MAINNKAGLYSASKAALISASETLRLELAPLGIRTLTLMTAGTKSTMFDNFKPSPIPETSYYFGIKDFLRELGDGRMQEGGMNANEWAGKVVNAVQRGAKGKYWPGATAGQVRLMAWLFPQSFIVSQIQPF